jgi:hypothetical protein
VVPKDSERLAVNKQTSHQFDVDSFNLKNLSELEVRKQGQIKISNRFTALESLNYSEGVKRAWENIKGKGKGKAVPLQVWSGPEGYRKLR